MCGGGCWKLSQWEGKEWKAGTLAAVRRLCSVVTGVRVAGKRDPCLRCEMRDLGVSGASISRSRVPRNTRIADGMEYEPTCRYATPASCVVGSGDRQDGMQVREDIPHRIHPSTEPSIPPP